jgi:hypothetical protein
MLSLAIGDLSSGHEKAAFIAPLARGLWAGAKAMGPAFRGGAAAAPMATAGLRGTVGAGLNAATSAFRPAFNAGRAMIPGAGGQMSLPGMGALAAPANAPGASAWFGRMMNRVNPIMSGGTVSAGARGQALPAATRFNVLGRANNAMASIQNPWMRRAMAPARFLMPRSWKGLAGGTIAMGAIQDRATMAERVQQGGDYATARVLAEMRNNPAMAMGAAWGDPNLVAQTLAQRGLQGAGERYHAMVQDPNQMQGQLEQMQRGLKWDWLPGVNNLGY